MGVVWAACAAGESLWLDELHTSWTVSGAWSEVAARAKQGNQSPLFFYGLFALAGTLGNLGGIPGELLLRLPSMLCWAATLFVCLRITTPAIGWRSGVNAPPLAVGVAVVLWMLLDRIQLFYATEARVYAMVQLVSLLAWCCVARLTACGSPKTASRSILLWCLLSVLLINLHLTAVLACGWQIACGTWVISRRSPRLRLLWAAAVTVVLMAVAVAWQLSSQVWEHRQQWASFAGDASWSALIGLFPLAAYLGPVAAARGLDWLCCRRGQRPTHQHQQDVAQWLWWIAVAGPWLSAWGITGLGLAPVFHRRFVIVAAVPLLLVAATQLPRIRLSGLRSLAVFGVAMWLMIGQGTLDNWRAGVWYGWQRSEGWRQASQFLQAQVKPGETVWCCSGLIEAAGAKLPLNESLNRYLSFPLRGLYRVVDADGKPLAPKALIGNGESWRAQLFSADRRNQSGLGEEQGGAGGATAENFPGDQLIAGDQWIVYRGSPESFKRHLESLQQPSEVGQPTSWQIGSPRSFGLVSLVRLSRDGRSGELSAPSDLPSVQRL